MMFPLSASVRPRHLAAALLGVSLCVAMPVMAEPQIATPSQSTPASAPDMNSKTAAYEAPSVAGAVDRERVKKTEIGLASWYGPGFISHKTASGERFSAQKVTAAAPHLPLGTHVRVTNLKNGRTVTVRVNDRGPYAPGRIIDLSPKAAQVLAMTDDGVARVRLEILD